jgi:hypothetical protein
MAFYGSVTLNGATAPAGTMVRAYYGTTLAGQSTVDSTGAYGDSSSTGAKLLVDEGTGIITFTFQSPSILSGQESSGTTAVSYAGFQEGLSVNQDLAFTYTVPTSGGGGGGGGGGGSSYTTPTVTTTPAVIPTITPKIILGCDNRTTGFSITTGMSCIGNTATTTTPIITAPTSTTTPVVGQVLGAQSFHFTLTLKKGSKGNEVIELQKFLNANGYNCGTADGSFGAKVKTAVIKFQIANKLIGDGVVGAKVRAILNK